MPTDGSTTPEFSVVVTVSTPQCMSLLYVTNVSGFYCAQKGHCKSGMVFAINPPATGNTYSAFKNLAMGGGMAASTATAFTSTTISVPPSAAPSMPAGMVMGTNL